MVAMKGVVSLAIFCALLTSIWIVNYAVSVGAIHNQWMDEANATGWQPVDTPWHTVPLQWVNEHIGEKQCTTGGVTTK